MDRRLGLCAIQLWFKENRATNTWDDVNDKTENHHGTNGPHICQGQCEKPTALGEPRGHMFFIGDVGVDEMRNCFCSNLAKLAV